MGSASETEYLILLAHELKYLNTNEYTGLTNTGVSIKKTKNWRLIADY